MQTVRWLRMTVRLAGGGVRNAGFRRLVALNNIYHTSCVGNLVLCRPTRRCNYGTSRNANSWIIAYYHILPKLQYWVLLKETPLVIAAINLIKETPVVENPRKSSVCLIIVSNLYFVFHRFVLILSLKSCCFKNSWIKELMRSLYDPI